MKLFIFFKREKSSFGEKKQIRPRLYIYIYIGCVATRKELLDVYIVPYWSNLVPLTMG